MFTTVISVGSVKFAKKNKLIFRKLDKLKSYNCKNSQGQNSTKKQNILKNPGA